TASPTTAASTAPRTRAGSSTPAPTTGSATAGPAPSATATSRSRRRSPTAPRSTSTSRARSSASPTASEARLDAPHRTRLHARGGPQLPRPPRRQAGAGAADGRPAGAHVRQPQGDGPGRDAPHLAPRQPQGLRADVRRLLPHGKRQARVAGGRWRPALNL